MDNHAGCAAVAYFHKANAMPAAEFAALMSTAGLSTFDEALKLYEAAPVAVGGHFDGTVPRAGA